MIRYTLKCDQGHSFDSWFASAGAYDTLAAQGHLSCAFCGSARVDKALMAPAVAQATDTPSLKPPAEHRSEIERKLAELREHIEKNSDYVGTDFADQARAMYLGDIPERAIWGEARPDEARGLIEDGIPVAPLPIIPRTRSN